MNFKAVTTDGDHVTIVGVVGNDVKSKFVAIPAKGGKALILDMGKVLFESQEQVSWEEQPGVKPQDLPQDAEK